MEKDRSILVYRLGLHLLLHEVLLELLVELLLSSLSFQLLPLLQLLDFLSSLSPLELLRVSQLGLFGHLSLSVLVCVSQFLIDHPRFLFQRVLLLLVP